MTMNIIILHGWGSSPQKWEKVKSELIKKNFKVIIPYLPGFNPKDPIKSPWSINDYTKWFNQYLNQKKLKKIILIGHSNGGRIASYFTSQFPERVEKLILIASAGLPPKNKIKIIFFKFISKIGKIFFQLIPSKKIYQFAQKTLYFIAREKDYLNANPVMKKTLINMTTIDLTEVFTKIKTPTLIIWGENDRETPLWMGKKINQLIKKSKLEIIKDGNHSLHISQPKKLVSVILKYI